MAADRTQAATSSRSGKPGRVEQPQGCTNFKIRQLMRQVSQRYDAELGKSGLKTTQYSLLAHVEKLGPIQPRALAAVMRMDASTLSRNMKPLVDAGWLEVLPGHDERSRSVVITAAGSAKREEARHHWRAAQDQINKTLGVDRVLALHALIDDALGLMADEENSDE